MFQISTCFVDLLQILTSFLFFILSSFKYFIQIEMTKRLRIFIVFYIGYISAVYQFVRFTTSKINF